MMADTFDLVLERADQGHLLRPPLAAAALEERRVGDLRGEVVQHLERHSGVPNTRSRATPPSG